MNCIICSLCHFCLTILLGECQGQLYWWIPCPWGRFCRQITASLVSVHVQGNTVPPSWWTGKPLHNSKPFPRPPLPPPPRSWCPAWTAAGIECCVYLMREMSTRVADAARWFRCVVVQSRGIQVSRGQNRLESTECCGGFSCRIYQITRNNRRYFEGVQLIKCISNLTL